MLKIRNIQLLSRTFNHFSYYGSYLKYLKCLDLPLILKNIVTYIHVIFCINLCIGFKFLIEIVSKDTKKHMVFYLYVRQRQHVAK